MKMLQVDDAFTLLTLSDRPDGTRTLTDQAEPYLAQSPKLILDVRGILLTSMIIGELLNLQRRLQARWEHRTSRLVLVNLTPLSREALQRAHLDAYMPVCDSVEDAIRNGT